jgi:hypothetical protein
MPGSHLRFFARFHQPITSVLPHRFKKPVAGLATLHLNKHQRLVHESGQEIQDGIGL